MVFRAASGGGETAGVDDDELAEIGRRQDFHRDDPLHPLKAPPPRRDEADGRAMVVTERFLPDVRGEERVPRLRHRQAPAIAGDGAEAYPARASAHARTFQ